MSLARRPGSWRSALAWAGVGLLAVGCTSMLGIDGDYVEETSSAHHANGTGSSTARDAAADTASPGTGGATGSGGAGGEGLGGTPEAGGSPEAGGTPGAGGNGTCQSASDCGSGEKCCFPPGSGGAADTMVCTPPLPIIGCSTNSCLPCPAPQANGVATCNAGACAIQCNGGYHLSRGECIANLGTAGGTGAGGSGTKCDPKACPSSCGVVGPLPCCTNNGTCGCTWAPGAVCY